MREQLENVELKHAEDKLELEVNLKDEYNKRLSEAQAIVQSDTMVCLNVLNPLQMAVWVEQSFLEF